MTCEMNAPDFYKKVFNTLSSFLYFDTFRGKAAIEWQVSFYEEKKITVGKTLSNLCVAQMCLKPLLIDYHNDGYW